MQEREEYSAKQVATRLGVDAKKLRKFFRGKYSQDAGVGRGGRYIFKPEELERIRIEYAEWRLKVNPKEK